MKYCVCEVLPEYCEFFDGSRCRVLRVLQVFDTEQAAEEALEVFGSVEEDCRYMRVVPSDLLNEEGR